MEATTTNTATSSTTPLDRAFVEDWARRFADAWNRLDPDGVAAFCTEDVVWEDPTLPRTAHGREDVRAFIRASAQAFPDFHLGWRSAPYIAPDEPIVLIRNRLTGTMSGTWSYTGLEATGQSIDILGVDEFRFRGELLEGVRSYFDRSEMARQIGVLPPVGSPAEQVLTRFRNLQTRLKRRRG